MKSALPILPNEGEAMSDTAVIIVSWNCREQLFRCLESLKENAPPDIEIIVVDNASSDGTVEEGQKRFPSVSFLGQEKNLGFARANNLASDQTDAEFLLILNPDAYLQPHATEVLHQFLKDHPDCALAAPLLLDEEGRMVDSVFRFPSLWNYWTEHSFLLVLLKQLKKIFRRKTGAEVSHYKIREIAWATGAAFMLRRSALGHDPVFDERFFLYSEDADLCKRLALQGWKRNFVPEAHVTHSHRTSSRKARAATIFHLFNSMDLYFGKHKSLLSRFLLRLSISVDMLLRIMIIIISRPKGDFENRERLKGYRSVLVALNPFRKKSRK